MPPQKRPYIPKTKGCYQCSRRRVNCDRAEPQCQKCLSRGLECSGLGVRHRFENGVASRGNWAGKADMQAIYEDEKDGVLIRRARKRNLARQENTAKRVANTANGQSNETERTRNDDEETQIIAPAMASIVLEEYTIDPIPESLDLGESFEEIISASALELHSASSSAQMVGELCSSSGYDIPWPIPSNIPSWKTQLFQLFSQHISYEMVAVDGLHNGWRHLILPFAQHDELVMNAVLTVSAFHFRLNVLGSDQYRFGSSPQCIPDPNELYKHVICGLKQQHQLDTCNIDKKHSVLMTILVLIVGTMVTGRSDFPFLFRMLESALQAVGGDGVLGSSDAAAFILSQVNKLRVYSAPLLNEETALQVISSPTNAAQLLNSLSHKLSFNPESAVVLSFVNDLVQQALDIYLHQFFFVGSTPTETDVANSIARVQHFKETLEAYPAGAPGEQVLIWASFVAASGSQTEEHMEFFENVFLRHYARNGFGNIRRALEYLRKVWAREPGMRWTSLLADAKFLVM
ncbi:unnamed protein product [Clonostachys solani]|uniref:Zn(2)-C6 fungal-type domain-containing protein n=1 Tax=Clonostachys solani TaxID=160281 RepID=A0A9P0ERL3_9HYPO|nr:unnamed protein product [Clonostachys solani]